MAFRTVTTALAVLAASSSTFAVDLDVDSTSSVKNAAATIAYGLMSYYTGNQTGASNPGYFDRPTYWWEGGAVWGSLISYYALSNDSSYNPTVTDGLLAQVGQDDNYMPANQTKDLGNDDQSSWALACMDALELGFPNPPSDRPQWLQLAENVWNAQVARWNVQECGGGLKWQLYSFSNGFSYRNSASNGGFFQLSARLARYTGNQTYFDWADKTWDWMSNIGLIGSDSSVYDGTDDTQNCTLLDHVEWSINSGLMLYGSAVLYDYTNGSRTWQSRTELLAEHAYKTFVSSNNSTGILTEIACESNTPANCNTDQIAYKGLFARWLARSTLLVPSITSRAYTLLRASARGAAQSCVGGTDKTSCGLSWTTQGYDDMTGVSEQLSALDTVQTLLLFNSTSIKLAKQGQASSGPTASNSTTSTTSTNSTTGSGTPAASSGSNSTSSTGAADALDLRSSTASLVTVLLVGLSIQWFL